MIASFGPAASVADSDGKHRGSAFCISNTLLLTALHCVLDDDSPKVKLLGTEEYVQCTTVWKGDIDDVDVAILRAEGKVLPNVEIASIGQFIGTGRRNCDVTGFPLDWDRQKEMARHLTGTIDPAAYPGANFLVLELSRSADLVGFGGAGVCAEGKLIGIAFGWIKGENSLIVVPASRLLEDAGFAMSLRLSLNTILTLLNYPLLKQESLAHSKVYLKLIPKTFKRSQLHHSTWATHITRMCSAKLSEALMRQSLLVSWDHFIFDGNSFALVSKQLSAALISSVGGAIVEVVSGLNFWLYSRTSIQLNSFHVRLERMQRYLVANSVAASLSGEHRESTLEKLVKIISEGESRQES